MTLQIRENLVYNGESFKMVQVPFNDYLRKNNVSIPRSKFQGSNCWRGYIGNWEIKNDKLFLTGIQSFGYSKNLMKYFFPGKGEVLAEWFSGEITLLYGIILERIPMKFDHLYEKNLFLVIENGVLVKQYEVDNTEKYQESLKQRELEERDCTRKEANTKKDVRIMEYKRRVN